MKRYSIKLRRSHFAYQIPMNNEYSHSQTYILKLAYIKQQVYNIAMIDTTVRPRSKDNVCADEIKVD